VGFIISLYADGTLEAFAYEGATAVLWGSLFFEITVVKTVLLAGVTGTGGVGKTPEEGLPFCGALVAET
jgi:hypothetical protein